MIKSVRTFHAWANEYWHSIWLTWIAGLIFVFGILCLAAGDQYGGPNLFAEGDLLLLLRMLVPESHRVSFGFGSMAFALTIIMFIIPAIKRDWARSKRGQQLLSDDTPEDDGPYPFK